VYPIVFYVHSVPIYSYGIMISVGWLLGLWCSCSYAARLGIDPGFIWKLGWYMIPVAIVSSKIWLVLSAWRFYVRYAGESLVLRTLHSGGSFYGGLVGAMLLVACTN
jgi:phosphatidylglycerol:prolipoprotein diacylglycerol transferase